MEHVQPTLVPGSIADFGDDCLDCRCLVCWAFVTVEQVQRTEKKPGLPQLCQQPDGARRSLAGYAGDVVSDEGGQWAVGGGQFTSERLAMILFTEGGQGQLS